MVETISFGVCIGQLCINLWLTERLAGHLKESNEIIMFASVTGYLNDLSEVRRIVCLDV